jgi:hypothetical protein
VLLSDFPKGLNTNYSFEIHKKRNMEKYILKIKKEVKNGN